MRQTSSIESLNYGILYLTGCAVSALLSLSQNTPLQRMVVHVACSWGYVVYWVLNSR
jgi:hypothetical protein